MKKLPKQKPHSPKHIKLNESLRTVWVLVSFVNSDILTVAKTLKTEDYNQLEITVKKLVTTLSKERRNIVFR